jgi:hypothetical protein
MRTVTRRFQIRTPYWYCTKCDVGSTGYDAEDGARAHVEDTGHEARVAAGSELILRPAELEAVACG